MSIDPLLDGKHRPIQLGWLVAESRASSPCIGNPWFLILDIAPIVLLLQKLLLLILFDPRELLTVSFLLFLVLMILAPWVPVGEVRDLLKHLLLSVSLSLLLVKTALAGVGVTRTPIWVRVRVHLEDLFLLEPIDRRLGDCIALWIVFLAISVVIHVLLLLPAW